MKQNKRCFLYFFFVFAIVSLCLLNPSTYAGDCSRLALFDRDIIHASGTGPNFSHTWGLINRSGCSFANYSIGNPEMFIDTGSGLVPYSGSISNPVYSGFTLEPNGGTASVSASFNFSLPETPQNAIFRIYFDVIDDSGNSMPYISTTAPGYGRLFTDIGRSIGACFAPPPAVNYANQANFGNGTVGVQVDVTNEIGPPDVEIDDNEQDSVESSDGGYVSEGPTGAAFCRNTVIVPGGCNLTALLSYLYRTNRSAFFGVFSKLNPCSGFQGYIGDPVNLAIGNFIQQESDGVVAGLGGTTIKMERTYNSQAVLWTPASMRRYFPDSSYEVVAEPPQYFGKGWTSVFGEYLLQIDMAPVFKGVQILYSDGHTANFREDGDGKYVSDSPANFDVITKQGSEYVLKKNGCNCSLESKRYNSDGKLIALSDKNGNEIRLVYAGDNLAYVENASGRRIEFDVDGEGRITKAMLPEGITLVYEYSDDMLTAFINGRGLRTEYKYDNMGQMTEIITPKGHSSVKNTYDDEFRVVHQSVWETEEYTFEYKDKMTRVTDSYGHTYTHHYDDAFRLVQIDDPEGNSELYEYDQDSNKTYYMDQAGAEWKWTYDEKGNRLTADGPLGWHRLWEYNEKNQVTRMAEQVDADSLRETRFEYDSKGNLIKFCNALGDCGYVVYDSFGLPVELTDFSGNKTVHVYDSEGDLVSVADAVNAITRFDHDGLGRTVTMKKPMGSTYSYTFDKNSNLTDVNGPIDWHISFVFDENDLLSVKTDPNGGTIKYEYNLSDRVQKVNNQLDFNVASYTYGLMNELAGFTDAEGRSWSYEYDPLLRVNHVAGPLDTHFKYAYNPVGRIVDLTDANGVVTHTEYDDLYRPVSVIRNYRPGLEPNSDTNVTNSFEYDLVGSVLKSVDPEGFVTKFVYDLMGRRTYKQDAENYEWTYEYDPMGNLTKVLNPRGFETIYKFTPVYRLQESVNQEGHAAIFNYNADGLLTDKTDPNKIVTHFEYDELGRLVMKSRNYLPGAAGTSEINVRTGFAYDLAGNLRFLKNPKDYQAEFVYDAAHRRTNLFDFESGQAKFAYDKVNNLLSVIDAEGNPVNNVYDDLNRLISVTNAENETKRFDYDKMGNRTNLIEADGTVTLYEYDYIYRLNAVTQNYRPEMGQNNDTNALTQYAYDARGLLTQFINANNAATSFAFNKVGRMVQEIDPLNNVWKFTYDGMGNRTTRKDANGDLTEYDYYPDDMLREIRYTNNQSVTYMYDPNNNRINMTDWLGITSWNYDPLNRVSSQGDAFNRGLFYKYDAASNRTGITYPDGNQVDYTYSPNNWMASAIDPKGGIIEYTRDKVGNILHIANPNLTETDIAYDRVYRTLTMENRQDKGQGINSAFTYTYNVLGHVTQAVKQYGWRNPGVVTETYDYDGLHRLVGAVIDPIKNNGETEVMSYEYDPVGNRMKWESSSGLTTSTLTDGFTKNYTYNAANQLLTVNTDSVKKNKNINLLDSYTYDANGNRINRISVDENDKNALIQGMDYAFDPENRLIQALEYQLGGKKQKVRTDRGVTDLEYDGGGRRLVKHYDPKSNDAQGVDKEVQYVFDGLDPVAEYDMLNGQRDNYYRGANGWITTMHHFNSGSDGGMYWYHYNRKGDVAGLTKHNGNSAHNYRYDPYGGVVPETGNFTDPHNHYTLTGKEFDENTGLVWFGARHYDPEVGVWLTQDSYRGVINKAQSLNRYMYVYDNPVNLLDLYGYATLVYIRNMDLLIVILTTGESYTINATSGNEKYSSIPLGKWEIKVEDLSDPGLLRDLARNNPINGGDWGDWRVPLRPLFDSDEFDSEEDKEKYFIHGGIFPGSAGCIDVGGSILPTFNIFQPFIPQYGFGNLITNKLKDDLLNDPESTLHVIELPKEKQYPEAMLYPSDPGYEEIQKLPGYTMVG
ncbi:RHS and YD repeat-containing protein [Desulfonema limicola]|uniref:RHS and YD repeat-containing protein n=1 Tax=Desulfonema limicola TaxID=45656 RepID=A0A975BEG7_9BACT|nr:RHS repeat-associated core domain-containing protein [Desulfonema limicola]QTA83823.1 RHS and YD repeat-containing protein [Desulfonema limicola]